MNSLILGISAAFLALNGSVAGASQDRQRESGTVKVIVIDGDDKIFQLHALPRVERQRVLSLREALQRWSDGQEQRVNITIFCKYPPLSCTITIQF